MIDDNDDDGKQKSDYFFVELWVNFTFFFLPFWKEYALLITFKQEYIKLQGIHLLHNLSYLIV